MPKKREKFDWRYAPDIKARAEKLIHVLKLDNIVITRVFFYRSTGSKSRAYARTWGLPKLWQHALKVTPAYIIEVISRHFDHLSPRDQDRVIMCNLTDLKQP